MKYSKLNPPDNTPLGDPIPSMVFCPRLRREMCLMADTAFKEFSRCLDSPRVGTLRIDLEVLCRTCAGTEVLKNKSPTTKMRLWQLTQQLNAKLEAINLFIR